MALNQGSGNRRLHAPILVQDVIGFDGLQWMAKWLNIRE